MCGAAPPRTRFEAVRSAFEELATRFATSCQGGHLACVETLLKRPAASMVIPADLFCFWTRRTLPPTRAEEASSDIDATSARYGADPRAVDEAGVSALPDAAFAEHQAVVLALVKGRGRCGGFP